MQALFAKDEDGVVRVIPEIIYPHYLNVIGHRGDLTQNALEEARLVFTQDLFNVLGAPLHLRIMVDKRFKLANFSKGEGEPRRLDLGTAYNNLPGTPATRLGLL